MVLHRACIRFVKGRLEGFVIKVKENEDLKSTEVVTEDRALAKALLEEFNNNNTGASNSGTDPRLMYVLMIMLNQHIEHVAKLVPGYPL